MPGTLLGTLILNSLNPYGNSHNKGFIPYYLQIMKRRLREIKENAEVTTKVIDSDWYNNGKTRSICQWKRRGTHQQT